LFKRLKKFLKLQILYVSENIYYNLFYRIPVLIVNICIKTLETTTGTTWTLFWFNNILWKF